MPGKNIGKLSIRVIPDATKFRSDLKLLIERVEKSMAANITVRADTREARAEIIRFKQAAERTAVNVGLNLNTGAAAARIAALSRTRKADVEVHARVNQASFNKVAAQVATFAASLSGARLANRLFQNLNEHIAELDLSLPKIARVATGIAAVVSGILAAGAGLITVSADLASIGTLGLVLPGMLLALTIGFGTLFTALRDGGQYLGELRPRFTELRQLISDNFWSEATEPIIRLVNDVFPQLEAGFGRVATALGRQAGAVADSFREAFANDVLRSWFDYTAMAMDIVTAGMQPLIQAFVTLGSVGLSYMPRFAQWVVDIGAAFNTWLQGVYASGELNEMLEDSISAAKAFGSALAGFFSILSGINEAASAAGGGGIYALAAALNAVAAIVNGPVFQTALTTILQGAAAGVSALAGGLGSLIGTVGALAPEINTVLTLAGQALGGLATAVAAGMQQPAFRDGLVNLFAGLKAGIDALGPAMGPLAELFGYLGTTVGIAAAAIGPLLAAIKITAAPLLETLLVALNPVIQILAGGLTQAVSGLGPLFGTLGATITALAPILADIAVVLVTLLIGALDALGPALQAVAPVFLVLGQALGQILPVIANLALALVQGLAPVFIVLASALSTVLPLIANLATTFLQALLPPILALLPALVGVAAVLLDALVTAIGVLLPPLGELANVLGPVLGAVLASLMPVLVTLAPMIGQILVQAVTAVAPVLGMLGSYLAMVLQAIAPLIPEILSLVASLLPIIPPLLSLVSMLLPQAVALFMALIPPIIQLAVTIIRSLLPIIQSIITVLTGLIQFVVGVFTGDWKMAFEGIKNIIGGLIGVVVNVVKGVVGILGGLAKAVVDILGNVGRLLFESGQSMIQGFLDGIKSMAGKVGQVVGDIVGKVRDFFPFSPAKVGPFSGRGWVLYSGRAIGRDMAKGIEQSTGTVRRAAESMTAAAAQSADVSVASTVTASADGVNGTGGGGDTYNITEARDGRETADAIQIKKKQARMTADVRRVTP